MYLAIQNSVCRSLQPTLAFLDVGLKLVTAVADAPVPRVPLGELAVDELGRAAAHDVGIKASLELSEERLLAPQITRLEQRGPDRQIGFGMAQAFFDRARRLPDFQAEVPQEVEKIFDHLLGVRGLLVGQQKQQVDVGIGREFAASVSADGDDRQPFARGRVGKRKDFAGDEVKERADQLVHHKALLAHHRGAIAARLEAGADFGATCVQRRLQWRDERPAIECGRSDRAGDARQLLRESAPVDDVALPCDAGHPAPPPELGFPLGRTCL